MVHNTCSSLPVTRGVRAVARPVVPCRPQRGDPLRSGSKRTLSVLLTGAVVGLAAALLPLLRAGAPEILELTLYDARAAAAAAWQPASREVVLVAVDEDTVRLAGGVHPLPRGALAAIVEEALAAGARVVALDYLLEDPLEGSFASENAALERALASGNVVLATAFPPARIDSAPGTDARVEEVRRRHARPLGGAARPERFALSSPLPRFALAAAALGGVSQRVGPNGRIYALRHVYPAAEGDYLSLPFAAAWLARGRPPLRLEPGRLWLGETPVPLEPDGTAIVRWFGPHEGRTDPRSTYPEVSAARLLEARLAREGEGPGPPEHGLGALRGRIAVVTQTLAGTKDKTPTPVNPDAVGGEVIANAVDDLLRGRFVRRVPPLGDAAATLGLSLASALLVALVAARAVRPWAVVAVSTAGTALLVAAWWGVTTWALSRGTWLPAFAPILGALATAFAADLRLLGLERRDRRFVHDALGRYTSPALVDELLRNRDLLDRFGGTRQDLTVYFSDIRGFTTVSEKMDPEALVALLNEYLSTLTEVVERHGGYVDKYIGDALMAVWGAPVPAADHALRACAAALEMRERIVARRAGWKERFGVEIDAGAGLNTGPMIAGNVGSRQKTNYTVLGDAVNLASRLEGATKIYGVPILIGEGTRAAAGPAIAARPVDVLQVKGKQQGVPVHELMGLAGALPPERQALLEAWLPAIQAYRDGHFGEALAGFEHALAVAPADGPATLYVARCRDLVARPPPPGWNGIHVLHDK
jgi:adenylate cyclase